MNCEGQQVPPLRSLSLRYGRDDKAFDWLIQACCFLLSPIIVFGLIVSGLIVSGFVVRADSIFEAVAKLSIDLTRFIPVESAEGEAVVELHAAVRDIDGRQ
jgi:hypothetical protein